MASPIFEVGDIVTPTMNASHFGIVIGREYKVTEIIDIGAGYQCRLEGVNVTPHEKNLKLVQKGTSIQLSVAYFPGDLVEALTNFPCITTAGKVYAVIRYDPPKNPPKANLGIITFQGDDGTESNIYENHFKLFHQNSTSRVAAMGVGGSGLAPAAVVVNKPKKQVARRLSSLGEKVKSEFEALYAKQGCTCDPVVSPHKCSHCTHPGNPKNIEFYEEYWEDAPPRSKADAIWDAIQGIAGKGNT